MIALLLAVAIGLGPKTHDVDLIEFNHARLPDGQVIDQLIFYDWLPDYRRFELVAVGSLDYGVGVAAMMSLGSWCVVANKRLASRQMASGT